jgi:hypothetical protein
VCQIFQDVDQLKAAMETLVNKFNSDAWDKRFLRHSGTFISVIVIPFGWRMSLIQLSKV